ncbi:MAG TPA: DUF1638 domain-containing protein [Armatimonadota bacterium]|jgi:hypothetical protein
MRFKLISCEVLLREVALCAASSPHVIDLVFLPKTLHDQPRQMTRVLQEEIDRTDPAQDEAVVLGYGLCSRGTAGLRARQVPLVIPRCHDCISLFLGSRSEYARLFREQPGTYYFTAGWIERGGAETLRLPDAEEGGVRSLEEYVEKYGEDNGRFLWEFENQWQKHYTTAAYVNMPLVSSPAVREAAQQAAAQYDWQFQELPGSDRLFRAMCAGDWNADDFLTVPPGWEIAQATDDSVLKAVEPL